MARVAIWLVLIPGHVKSQRREHQWIGFVLLPVTVSKQELLCLNCRPLPIKSSSTVTGNG